MHLRRGNIDIGVVELHYNVMANGQKTLLCVCGLQDTEFALLFVAFELATDDIH